MPLKSIFLIGPRCSGKTTVGKLLGKALDCPVLDTDAMITEEAGATVPEIVEREGWPGFRLREALTLGKAALTGAVVCTGGGIILDHANVALMRLYGTVFYLAAPLAVLQERISKGLAASERPSLTGTDPIAEMQAVLAAREPLYRAAAHFVVNAELPPKKVVRAIERLLMRGGNRENYG